MTTNTEQPHVRAESALLMENEPLPTAPPFAVKMARTEAITRELASWLANLPASPVERELAPRRLKHLQSKAKKRLLITFHWATVELDGRVLRINGQHSSKMLTALEPFPEGLFAHIDHYVVGSEADMAQLFRQFDDRTSSRTSSDVAAAYQGLQADLRGIDRRVAKLGIEGYAWHERKVEGLPIKPGDDQYIAFNNPNVHPFLLWLGGFLTPQCQELRSVPVVAAMWACYLKNPSSSAVFWELVAAGGEPGAEANPASRLDEWLRSLREEKGADRKPPPSEVYQGCINAWNAHRKERDLNRIHSDVKKGFAEPI